MMLLSLVVSAALPDAFGAWAAVFAVGYAVLQVGRTAFIVAAVRGDRPLLRNFVRILAWLAGAGVFWVVGGFVPPAPRLVLWIIALLIDYCGPAVAFYVPGLGRSSTADWTIAGEHLAERCHLFVLIALGESIVETGASFSELTFTA
jgi:low temperature requirement protein LtrA